MKFKYMLTIGITLISFQAIAGETLSVPGDAGVRLLKRLGITLGKGENHYYYGKNSAGACFVHTTNQPEGDDRSFISVHVGNFARNSAAIFQGRFGKNSGEAIEFHEDQNELSLVAHYYTSGESSPEAGYFLGMIGLGKPVRSLADIKIISYPDGYLKSVRARSWTDTTMGRLRRDSAECSELKRFTGEDLANQSFLSELMANSTLSAEAMQRFIEDVRQSLKSDEASSTR